MTEPSNDPDARARTKDSIVGTSIRQARAGLTPSAEDGFAAIMKAWNVSDEDARNLLGGISSSHYAAMKVAAHREKLPKEALIRISLLIGIFKALHTTFGSRLANAWMTLPNTNSMFSGTTPLAYCLEHGIVGMKNVRRLLHARCQGY